MTNFIKKDDSVVKVIIKLKDHFLNDQVVKNYEQAIFDSKISCHEIQ